MGENLVLIVLAAVVGMVVGFIAGKVGAADNRLKRDYEERLEKLQAELDAYRNQVSMHFDETARLMSEMTANYKAVYHHLAAGAQSLADGDSRVVIERDEQQLALDAEAVSREADEKAAKGIEEPAVEVTSQAAANEPADEKASPEGEDRVSAARQAGL